MNKSHWYYSLSTFYFTPIDMKRKEMGSAFSLYRKKKENKNIDVDIFMQSYIENLPPPRPLKVGESMGFGTESLEDFWSHKEIQEFAQNLEKSKKNKKGEFIDENPISFNGIYPSSPEL